jgi:hypothetical protein
MFGIKRKDGSYSQKVIFSELMALEMIGDRLLSALSSKHKTELDLVIAEILQLELCMNRMKISEEELKNGELRDSSSMTDLECIHYVVECLKTDTELFKSRKLAIMATVFIAKAVEARDAAE